MRFRTDAYRNGESYGGFTKAHFFPTAEAAIQRLIEIGWGFEDDPEAPPTWDAAEALLSETALVIDQEAVGAAGIVRILCYEKSDSSRLPVAVVRDRQGRELARVAVEDMAAA